MNNDLLNILSNLKQVDNQKLIDYLEGKLSAQEKHEVEQMLVDADFESDALEGLEQLKDKGHLNATVARMNKELEAQLKKRRRKRRKKSLGIQQWLIIAVIIILLLATLSYYIIRLLQKG
jgi:anti-sigma factor RsiW